MKRPSHWHFWTIKDQMLTGIGVNQTDAFNSAIKSFRLLHPGQFLYPIDHDRTVNKGKVSDEHFKWVIEQQNESDKIDTILSLCNSSSEVIRVCEAIGFDYNKALSRWATTPRKKSA